MGWFNRKRRQSSEEPKRLAFKNNEAAFEFACQSLDCAFDRGSPVLGLILEVHQNHAYAVKFANPDDPSIPTKSVGDLLDQGEIRHLNPKAQALKHVRRLSKGDLVLCVLPAKNGGGLDNLLLQLMVVITAKVKPIFEVAEDGGRWVED